TKARADFVAATHYTQPEPAPGQYTPAFQQANVTVTVTGVVFFDFIHGQRGVAANGVELHPVLDIRFGGTPSPGPTLSPTAPATPTPTPTKKPKKPRHHRPKPTPTRTTT